MGPNKSNHEANVCHTIRLFCAILIIILRWPRYLDNTVAGGIPFGLTPTEALVKECMEEASLEEDVVGTYVRATGSISYFFQ